ncbi:MAM and LDL-receptor class A domain-containing protein 1 [Tetranychus urticae]|uniref:MAM and LDL-receptor class A domain-containing protein 1 n=1 Tax=Tetranychus urticae TaxID=32264 RepID=UPI00077BA2B3|nr:MAM and LDL-receptor class A domain-containing protein 1 [Tetranychus urticae]
MESLVSKLIITLIVLNLVLSSNRSKCFALYHGFEDIDGPLTRIKRQESGVEDESSRTLVCDFGSGSLLSECSWTYPMDDHPNVHWSKGQGTTAYWLGGPLVDHTLGDSNGGYIYFETSYKVVGRVFSSAALESDKTASVKVPVKDDLLNGQSSLHSNLTNGQGNGLQSQGSLGGPGGGSSLDGRSASSLGSRLSDKLAIFKQPLLRLTLDDPIVTIPDKAHLESPNITRTGPVGHCIGFFFNIDGLSAEKLRLLVKDTETSENQTLWESRTHTDGAWIRAEVAYTYETFHQIILEGVAKSSNEPERAYRGYVAVDDISISPLEETEGVCHGHCTFEGGMCGWTNEPEADDFDWKLGRGSDNFFTGPARDYYSFSKEYPLGGFLYISAAYPRRPGDKAVLISPSFPATVSGPFCFKFATHMYGNGIGTLRVKYRPGESKDDKSDKILWEMSGESGNNWYQAQLPIASAVAFNIIFEGIIGPNYLGNIAIDSISIEQGVCPISPQTAARKSGDCTFEENMCYWTNPLPHSGVDDFDWIRQFSFGNYGPKHDHTKKNANGYFLSLNGDAIQPLRGGTSAWIISPEFESNPDLPKCMSFHYFMYQRVIEPGGPNLGGLRVYLRTVGDFGETILIPIWKLNNHQSLKWRRAQVPLGVKSKDGDEVKVKPPKNIYQVVIEGIWGDARVGSIALDDISFFDGSCNVIPANAEAVPGECSFDKTLCGWKNETRIPISKPGQLLSTVSKDSLISHKNAVSSIRSNLNDPKVIPVSWKLASPNVRPANLQDHTFRAPVGYVYFDVFNQNTLQSPTLRSPKFPAITGDSTKACLSFWFSGFGRGESTTLNIYQISGGETSSDADIGDTSSTSSPGGEKAGEKEPRTLLWSIQARFLETRRSLWYYGQVTVNGETPYQILVEGEAVDGGYALDDVTFYNGTCQTRPIEAAVKPKVEE